MKFSTRKKLAASFILLIVSVILLVTTHWGNRLIINVVTRYEPALSISLTSGSLIHSPKFSKIAYQNNNVSVSINDLTVNWLYRCLWHSKVCINNAEIANFHVVINDDQKNPPLQLESTSSVKSPVDAPISLIDFAIELLTIKQLTIESSNKMAVFRDIKGGVQLNDRAIDISSFNISDLTLEQRKLYGVNNAAPAHLPISQAANQLAQSLLTISEKIPFYQQVIRDFEFPLLPLNINLQQGYIKKIHYIEPRQHALFESIEFGAVQQAQEIKQVLLSMRHNAIDFSLDGAVSLTESMPLTLSVALQSDIDNHANITIEGNKETLTFNGDVVGQVNGQISGILSPLEKNVPFKIQSDFQTATFQGFNLEQGSMLLTGDLTRYNLQLDGRLSHANMPDLSGNITAFGDLSSIDIIDAKILTLDGQVNLSGGVDWHENITATTDVSFSGIEPHKFWSDYPGSISGALNADLSFIDHHWRADINKIKVLGDIRHKDLALSGQLQGQNDDSPWGRWVLDNIMLSHGENTISVSGFMAQDSELTARIDILDLGASIAAFEHAKTSRVIGNLSATGPLSALQITTQLSAEHLSHVSSGLSLAQASVVAMGTLDTLLDFTIDVNATGVSLGSQLKHGTLVASVIGNKVHHQLSGQLSSDAIDTKIDMIGELRDHVWQGKINTISARYNNQHLALKAPTNINIALPDNQISIASHCWISSAFDNPTQGSLCLQTDFEINTHTQRSNQAVIELAGFSIEQLQPYLPKEHQISGDIKGNLTFQIFSADKLNLSTHLAWERGHINSDINDNLIAHQIDELTIDAAVDRDLANIIAHLSSPTLGVIDVSFVSNIFEKTPFISGHIKSHGLQLAPYKPFLKYVTTLDGELSVSAGFSGDTTQQQIFGKLSSSNITLASDKLPSKIEKLNAELIFNGTAATIDSNFDLANGHGVVAGQLDWSEAPKADLTLNGSQLAITPQQGIDVVFSPQLAINLTPTHAKIRGDLSIDSANVIVQSLPESAVEISQDVVIKTDQPKQQSMAIDLDINTHLGNDLSLEAFGLKSNVSGDLHLLQNQQQPFSAYGELSLNDATYKAFGQQLMLESGQIIFTGSVNNPVINIKAIRDPNKTNDGVIAGVYVNGDVKQPALSVFSEPAKEQQEAISYLLRGYGLGTDSKFGQDMAIAMLLKGGLGGASKTINSIGDVVGIDNLNVTTTGSGDNTRVEFSGSIGPKLQLRYGVGVFDALPEVGLRYQVNQRLFVEFINNTDQALDLLYQFSFD